MLYIYHLKGRSLVALPSLSFAPLKLGLASLFGFFIGWFGATLILGMTNGVSSS